MKHLFFILTIFVLTISACGRGGTTTIHFSDISVERDGLKKYAFIDGSLFTGTAWSSDDKSASISFQDGIMQKAVVYQANGKEAVVKYASSNPTFYDEHGITMSEDAFRDSYGHLWDKIGALEAELRLATSGY